jgi:hypothetical protein
MRRNMASQLNVAVVVFILALFEQSNFIISLRMHLRMPSNNRCPFTVL